jgi:very-short-patch-repair endonuclease
MTTADDDNVVRDRVLRLFQYVRAINQLRNPIQRHIRELDWSLALSDLPTHPCITLSAPPPPATGAAADDASPTDALMRVERPTLKPIPPPPREISDWVEDGWQKFAQPAQIASSRRVDGPDGPAIQAFEDDPARVRIFDEWRESRRLFIEAEQPAVDAFAVFEQLYRLRGILERDAERFEIVLGDGVLCWKVPGGSIRFPVVLQRLELEFDPMVPAFTLNDAESPTEFNSALLRSIDSVDGAIVGAITSELAEGQYHPLMAEAFTAFLKSLPPRLAANGRFEDALLTGEPADPIMYRAPIIFLRKRTFGFVTALESIILDLQQDGEIAQSLQNIAGFGSLAPLDDIADEATSGLQSYEAPEDVLFTLEANEEQFRIAQTLARHKCVLVQGPPGTGKTHTIANITGHLLAQGKSILVTSSTTKALRVLREKVVAELQPLCVSVLESDAHSNDQLKASVDAIVERLSRSDEASLATAAQFYEKERIDAVAEMRASLRQLLNARHIDSQPVLIAGDSYAPIKAAKIVAEGQATDAWIPGQVTPGVALSLTTQEMRALYRTNVTVPRAVEKELALRLPDPALIPSPKVFAQLVDDMTSLAAQDLSLKEYWTDVVGEISAIESLIATLPPILATWLDADDWLYDVGTDGFRGRGHSNAWASLFAEVERLETLAETSREVLLRIGPSLAPDIELDEQHRLLEEIIAHLDSGGNLGWHVMLLRGKWKAVTSGIAVNGRPPRELDEYRALHSLASLELARRALRARWERQVVSIGGPALPASQPEDSAKSLARTMRSALEWYKEVFSPYHDDLVRAGFLWPKVSCSIPTGADSRGEFKAIVRAYLATVPAALETRRVALTLRLCERRYAKIDGDLQQYSGEFTERLRNSIAARSASDYEAAFTALVRIRDLTTELEARRTLLSKLAHIAPAWSEAISLRLIPHDADSPPGDVASAWRWVQLAQQLDEREKASLEDLERRFESRIQELREATAALVDAKAWLAQRQRTALAQQQALIGWLKAVKRIGKGLGKRVPVLRKVAREAMDQAKSAVPVWIMPLIRVAENYDPRTTKFDVVIIDEASQSDVTGLIALYYGRQVVVVGDDEQVSPEAVGQRIEETQHLIDEFLYSIPYAQLFDGRASIYDLAKMSFGGAISLREHFRCVPDIISFSNHLSYDDKMVPLREASQSALVPHVVAHRVTGASDEKINDEEALEIVSLIRSCLEQPEYNGKTFGVISLVGEDQARMIETLLRQHLEPADLEGRRLLCGNSAQFQGDERDVIFLSMVDSPRRAPLSMRDQPIFQKRFNVAASRARDQMWLVYSLDPATDLQPRDLRRRLIEHVVNPHALATKIEAETKKADSEFERDVLRRLITAGYKATSQYRVGAYRIDIMIEGIGSDRLAVECDGEQVHTMLELEKDLSRQSLLQRVGLTFHRIRGGKYFRNPDKEFHRLVDRLQVMGIEPISELSPHDPEVGGGLNRRVIARAREIREELSTTHDFEYYRRRTSRPSSVDVSGDSSGEDGRVALSPQPQSPADSNNRDVIAAPGRVPPNVTKTLVAATSSRASDQAVPQSANQITFDIPIQSSDPLIECLRAHGFPPDAIVDKRTEDKGCLWVVGGVFHRPFFEGLRREGIRFDYAEHGGRSTHHQAAWYSRHVS